MAPSKSEQIAAITPADVTEFVRCILVRRRPGGRFVWHLTYSREDARVMGVVKRELEALFERKEHPARRSALREAIDLVTSLLAKAAVAGEEVTFVLLPADLPVLEAAYPYLVEYEVLREKDALDRPRGRR